MILKGISKHYSVLVVLSKACVCDIKQDFQSNIASGINGCVKGVFSFCYVSTRYKVSNFEMTKF